MSDKLYICMYHYTRDLIHSRYPNIKGLDIKLFDKQLDFFKNNFNVVEMENIIEVVKGRAELPEKAMLLTFDDGYIDNFTYAMPLLEKYGMKGAFFIPGKTFAEHKLLDVNKIHYILASADINRIYEELINKMNHYRGTNFEFAATDELINQYAVENRFDTKETVFVKRMLQTVLPEKLRTIISSELFLEFVGVKEETLAYELYMTEDQIKTMKNNGMYIGVHGYDHYWLSNLSFEEMKKDVDKAIEVMDQFIDSKNWVMNYPYGNYNQNVISYIKENGACLGLTTNVRVANIVQDSPFELPRLDCNDFPPKSENFINM